MVGEKQRCKKSEDRKGKEHGKKRDRSTKNQEEEETVSKLLKEAVIGIQNNSKIVVAVFH